LPTRNEFVGSETQPLLDVGGAGGPSDMSFSIPTRMDGAIDLSATSN
jgi:hypothetical protein